MASHWYSNTGKCEYTVIGANGKERDTTLRDARKLNLVPSVTTIIAGAAAPGLDVYKENQLLDACMSIGYSHRCNDNIKWRRDVITKARQHSKNASEAGTKIHDALEQYYLGNGLTAEMHATCMPVVELLAKEFPSSKWAPEVSFGHRSGFGGKVDMSDPMGIILDFKTKDTDDIKKMIPYDGHGMQTAAYAVGLGMAGADRYNLFISTRVPGLISLTKSEDFGRDWGMFESLLTFWKLKNKYMMGE